MVYSLLARFTLIATVAMMVISYNLHPALAEQLDEADPPQQVVGVTGRLAEILIDDLNLEIPILLGENSFGSVVLIVDKNRANFENILKEPPNGYFSQECEESSNLLCCTSVSKYLAVQIAPNRWLNAGINCDPALFGQEDGIDEKAVESVTSERLPDEAIDIMQQVYDLSRFVLTAGLDGELRVFVLGPRPGEVDMALDEILGFGDDSGLQFRALRGGCRSSLGASCSAGSSQLRCRKKNKKVYVKTDGYWCRIDGGCSC